MKNRRSLPSRLVGGLIVVVFGVLLTADSRAVISETIPLNEIATPAFLIDHHETDGLTFTRRNGLLTSVDVSITRTFLDPAINAEYRVVFGLFDDSGTALELVNGGAGGSPFLGASPEFAVALSGLDLSYVDTLLVYPDPVATLDSKTEYTVRAALQRRPTPADPWVGAGSSVDSSPELVHHFTQATSGDTEWNIRATVSDLQWDKTYLLDTDSLDDTLSASIDATFARYDDWDDPISSENTTLIADFDLFEQSTGDPVPLEDDGIVTANWLAASYQTVFFQKWPRFQTVNFNADLRPLVQLESGSENYILRCTVRHIEDGIGTEFTDATCELAAQQLMHFDGDLMFGPIAAKFDRFAIPPFPLGSGPGYIELVMRVLNGHGILPDAPELVFGNSVPLIVRLLDNGDAVVQAGSADELVYDPLAPLDPVEHTTSCLTYTYGTTVLRFDGMVTNSLTVGLPQGLIYLPDTSVASHHGQSKFNHAATIYLDDMANLAAPVSVPLGPNSGIVDESQPLRIGVGSARVTPEGEIFYGSISSVEYIHDQALTQLENDRLGGQIDTFDAHGKRLDVRASNDHYLRGASVVAAAQIKVTAAEDKSSRMTAQFDLAAQSFFAHFPAEAAVSWGSDGALALEDGQVLGGSELVDVPTVDIPYHKTCPEDPCADDVPKHDVRLLPAGGELVITPTGGLHQEGNLQMSQQLEWGARGDGGGGIDPAYPYAHRTDEFGSGDFFMPGYSLFAADNPLLSTAPYVSAGGDNAPAALLLAGYGGDPGNPEMHFPTENEYELGDGHYPGINFVVQTSSDVGASRLGGNTSDYTYDLLDGGASKYYTRCAGVFGRQVGVDGSFNPTLKIYDYDFELTSFQLSFQASDQYESWINGTIYVTGHSDFSQGFLGLELNCLGELEGAEMDPDDDSVKNLVYWNSEFVPKSMRFEKELASAPGACPVEYIGYLTMGITTSVAHIPNELHGTFAFAASDGNLLTQTTGAGIGVDSELGIPASVPMAGPNEDYTLVPVGNLRFSNPDENPDSVVGLPGGWVTFGATIDVPYFRDFEVQVMTSANDTPAAPLYLAPGWTESGETFFSSKGFDPNHKSWPQGAISITEYQNPDESTSNTYLIHAEQDMFGLVPLSYPMQWNDTTRSFKSMNPNHEELFVIEVDHQVDYLDADATKISFGAKYEGLPEISLTNMLNEQIDGAAQAMTDAVSEPLKDALDQAFAEFEDFLADSLDAVIDPVIDEAAEHVLCPLYDEVKVHYDTARAAGHTWNQFKADLDAEIAARIYDTGFPTAATQLRLQLEKLSDVTSGAASMTSDLKSAIEQIIIGIDVIINEVELDGMNNPVFNVDPSAIVGGSSGLLKKGVGGEYEIVQNLVTLLLQELVEPEVEAVLAPLLSDLSSGLNTELLALLEDVTPIFDQIVEALAQVREFLVEVHTIVDTAAEFIADFDALVTAAITAADGFQVMMDKPATRAFDFLEQLAKNNGIDVAAGTDVLNGYLDLFEDFDKDEFIAALKAELKDAIMESNLMQQFQYLVRQTLYDFQLKFEQTISGVLAQISEVMKNLLSETLGAIEDEINPLLGKVNSVMGAAEISGYAEINGDSLRKLRLDASMQISIPDEMELNVFLEIISYTSEDASNGCVDAGDKTVEVTIGATDVPFDWISDGLRASLSVKMSLKDEGSGLRPNGVGGAFELTGGEISFQTFKITCLAATLAVGLDDCYLGARACGEFNSYMVSIGVFFGKTCTIDPMLVVDADVAEVLSGPFPLIGAYVYGEVWLPISELVLGIPASCLFNISAGVGCGVGFFIDGNDSPVFVGKMYAGVSGEALCIVSIKGEVTMVGVVQNGSFSASGTGKLSGKAGWCPFCIKFSVSAKVTYTDGDWDVDL